MYDIYIIFPFARLLNTNNTSKLRSNILSLSAVTEFITIEDYKMSRNVSNLTNSFTKIEYAIFNYYITGTD